MYYFLLSKTPMLLSAMSEMPPGTILHFDKALLVKTGIQLFNILVLVFILSKVLYKPVKKFMAERTAKIEARFTEAEEDANAAKELRQKYEALIANIEIEREQILAQGRADGLERSEEIVAAARKEAANIYRHSMDELRLEQENARDEMKRAIIEISTKMATHFVTLSVDSATQDHYIEEAMSHLEETLWES